MQEIKEEYFTYIIILPIKTRAPINMQALLSLFNILKPEILFQLRKKKYTHIFQQSKYIYYY